MNDFAQFQDRDNEEFLNLDISSIQLISPVQSESDGSETSTGEGSTSANKHQKGPGRPPNPYNKLFRCFHRRNIKQPFLRKGNIKVGVIRGFHDMFDYLNGRCKKSTTNIREHLQLSGPEFEEFLSFYNKNKEEIDPVLQIHANVSTANEAYCKSIFRSKLMWDAYQLYIDMLFSKFSNDAMCDRLLMLCCSREENCHKEDCEEKWRKMENFIRYAMCQEAMPAGET